MKQPPSVIAAAFANPVDRQLVAGFLAGLGYKTVPFSADGAPEADLFILDAPCARRFGRQVLEQKRKTGLFLPAVIALGKRDPVDPWLAAGFDDSLRLPFTRAELARRVEILLRARQQSQALAQSGEARYRAIFEGVNVAIWEEDFSEVIAALKALKAQGVTDFRAYLEEHPEFVGQALGLVQILDVNSETLRMFGAQNKAELLASLEAVFVPESLAVFREELIALAEGRRHFESEAVVQTLQGERFHILLSLAIPAGEAGFGHALVSMMDITGRVQAERALRESEERWRFLSQATTEGIVVHEEGRIVDLNEAGLRMAGYSREELIGQSILLLAHPDSVETILTKVRSGSEEPYEAVGLRKDGATFPCELRPRTLIRQGRPVRVVIIRDLTAQKQAEQALRRSNERLEVLHAIDRAILAAESPQTIAQAALAGLQRLIPCPRFSVALIDLEAGEGRLLAAFRDGEAQTVSGQPVPLANFGSFADLAQGQPRLIPDLEKAPVKSPEQERLLEDGIRATLTLPLLVEGELIGTLNLKAAEPGWFSEAHIEIAQDVANQLGVALLQARLREQLRRYAGELEQRVAERTRVLEERTADIEKLNRGMLAMLEDLQEANRRYKQASKELQAANAELKTFTYSVSHDLKAPLRGIEGYSRLLLADYQDRLDEDGQFFVANIRQAARQMNQLIDDLLDYSRMERRTLTPKTFSLAGLVEGLLVEKRAEIEAAGINVSLQIECAQITADRDGLTIALRNLLDNAIKFSAGAEQPKIEIGARVEDGRCVIRVKDNGVGFDMQYQERIFEIFQRLHTPEEYPGTGVGLAIVHKAMQRMGGRAWAESAPGEGATFYLEVSQ